MRDFIFNHLLDAVKELLFRAAKHLGISIYEDDATKEGEKKSQARGALGLTVLKIVTGHHRKRWFFETIFSF